MSASQALTEILDLAAWQAATPIAPGVDTSPDPVAELASMQAFLDAWAAKAPATAWGERERTGCQRVLATLVTQAAQRPRVALRGEPTRQGPLSHELAALLRPAHTAWDEPEELDRAIRYWEAARRASLLDDLLASDFGEFWRRVEWSGLQQHLDWLARGVGDERLLLAQVVKVVSRYVELAPLKRLLEASEPALLEAGFSLR